jgi:mannitol/fructose-specific phosphotransferase system IIA component (Ntr-type)
MLDIHAIIKPECILMDPEATDKESLIKILVDVLAADGAVKDPVRLMADVMAREKIASTGLGLGCAVPHANSQAAGRSAVALARLRQPMDFGAPDGTGATVVVLMAGPPEAMGAHLQIISKIARILHDPSFLEAAVAAKDGSELAEAFYSRS